MTANKKKLKFAPFLATCTLIAGLGTFGTVKLASAFFADSERHANEFGFTENVIKVEEPDFTPDPKIKTGTNIIPKRVFIKNESKIPVYARVKLEFSDPDAMAAAKLTNEKGTFDAALLDSNLPAGWVKGSDGYYYYTQKIEPGKNTNDLIKSVTTTYDDASAIKPFDIYVRAESVQTIRTVDTGSTLQTKDLTYTEAWSLFLQ